MEMLDLKVVPHIITCTCPKHKTNQCKVSEDALGVYNNNQLLSMSQIHDTKNKKQ